MSQIDLSENIIKLLNKKPTNYIITTSKKHIYCQALCAKMTLCDSLWGMSQNKHIIN